MHRVLKSLVSGKKRKSTEKWEEEKKHTESWSLEKKGSETWKEMKLNCQQEKKQHNKWERKKLQTVMWKLGLRAKKKSGCHFTGGGSGSSLLSYIHALLFFHFTCWTRLLSCQEAQPVTIIERRACITLTPWGEISQIPHHLLVGCLAGSRSICAS